MHLYIAIKVNSLQWLNFLSAKQIEALDTLSRLQNDFFRNKFILLFFCWNNKWTNILFWLEMSTDIVSN